MWLVHHLTDLPLLHTFRLHPNGVRDLAFAVVVVAPVHTAVADEMAAMNVHAAAFDDSGEIAVLVDADTLANAQNLAQHSVALEDDTAVGA